MIGYTTNNRGRFKCNFCDHSTYKTRGGIDSHLQTNHPHELELAKKDDEIRRLKNRPPQEKIVYRDAPEKDIKYYSPNIKGAYCPSCMLVIQGVRIPVGQTLDNTPHNVCKNTGLLPIVGGLY